MSVLHLRHGYGCEYETVRVSIIRMEEGEREQVGESENLLIHTGPLR